MIGGGGAQTCDSGGIAYLGSVTSARISAVLIAVLVLAAAIVRADAPASVPATAPTSATASATALPDLTITCSGPYFLKNVGSAAVPAGTQVRVTWQMDQTPPRAQMVKLDHPLEAGQSLQLNPSGWNDLPAGIAHQPALDVIRVQVNADCAVPEEDLANNTIARSFVVGTTRGGQLDFSADPAPTQVNLSAEGDVDWMHWGGANEQAACRKAGAHALGAVSLLGSGPMGAAATDVFKPTLQIAPGDLITFVWSDGEQSRSGNTSSMMWVANRGQGFRLIAPADRRARRLRIYVALFNALGRLDASLSDGSAPPLRTALSPLDHGPLREVVSFDYHAASDNQILTVTWMLADNHPADTHPLRIGAETLSIIK
jgi:hypothetical protein